MNITQSSAIVLGGIGGIGKEISLQLIDRGLKRFAIIDIVDPVVARPLLETEFHNIKFIYKQCSVTEELELRKCMNEISSELEWVDIIVNSAGIIDESKWKRTIDINFGGVVNSTLIGIDLMRKDQGKRGGTIVNIASIAALGARFVFPLYAGSKHAVLGFTRSLKNDKFLEETGVKFIAICPGITDTALIDYDKNFARLLFPSMVEEVKSICRNTPSQNVCIVGACVIAAIDDGENGSTWRCENGRFEKIEIFEYPAF